MSRVRKSEAKKREAGQEAVRLEECGATFEASLCEAPQDEVFS
jgi:hypothetical protein